MFHPRGPTFCELARQALSSTQRGYDLLAPKFDFTPFRTPDALLAEVAPLLGEPGSIRAALDLCCGTGAGMAMLRPLCRDRVVGVDFSAGMLDLARQRVPRAPGSAAVEFLHGDLFDGLPAAAFDLVTCFGALGHIPTADADRFADTIAAALCPGGRFACITSYRPPTWSATYWAARSFNAAMHLRNALVRPPFIMFYLTFLVPECRRLFEQRGCEVAVYEQFSRTIPSACLFVAAAGAPPGFTP